MKLTKELTLTASFTALLIGAQLVLASISGIEVVSVLIISYCYYFGARRGMILATAFSLLRCFLFGFFPAIIILYLIYYNLLAIVIGWLGRRPNKRSGVKELIVVCVFALIMTVCFTMLDNVVTPLFYAFSPETTRAYFATSIITLVPHCFCVVITVALLFIPLCKIYKMANL